LSIIRSREGYFHDPRLHRGQVDDRARVLPPHEAARLPGFTTSAFPTRIVSGRCVWPKRTRSNRPARRVPLQLVVGMGEEDLPPSTVSMYGPCRKAPPVASCSPSRSESLLPKTPRRGSPDRRTPRGRPVSRRPRDGAPSPPLGAKKEERAFRGAPVVVESERIPTFTRATPALGTDGREERLTDLLLAIGRQDLPPSGRRCRKRPPPGPLSWRSWKERCRSQRRQRARDVVEEADPVVGEDVTTVQREETESSKTTRVGRYLETRSRTYFPARGSAMSASTVVSLRRTRDSPR